MPVPVVWDKTEYAIEKNEFVVFMQNEVSIKILDSTNRCSGCFLY